MLQAALVSYSPESTVSPRWVYEHLGQYRYRFPGELCWEKDRSAATMLRSWTLPHTESTGNIVSGLWAPGSTTQILYLFAFHGGLVFESEIQRWIIG